MQTEIPAQAQQVLEAVRPLFGGSLLVAPVMEAGQRTKTVYLPAGTWYNAWTGEAVEGGRTVEADAPLTVIPVYTRDAGLLGVFKG